MVFGKSVCGSKPPENMTYPLFSSPTSYMSGAVWAGPERNWTNICNFSWQSVLKYTVSLCQFRRQLEQSPGLEVETIWQSPGFACPLNQRLGVGLCPMLNQHSTSSPLVPVHTDNISILNWQTGKLKIYNWSFTAGLGRKTGWPADNQDGPLIY